MNIINLGEADNLSKAVALGCFDGLHKGHIEVIRLAQSSPFPSCILTFSHNPLGVICGKGQPQLSSTALREQALMELKIDTLIYMDFDEHIRKMAPEQFVQDILVKIGAKIVCCGYNYHFGYNGVADVHQLTALCRKNNIEVKVAPHVQYNGMPISSTGIRNLVEQGDMRSAFKMMGRYFAIDFMVVSGNQLGRTIGAPTINQPFPSWYVLPKFGVYATRCLINNESYQSVTNVGIKPTAGGSPPQAETYIPNFSGDLYHKKIKVEFIEFIRPEQKFNSLDDLKAQIFIDTKKAIVITDSIK
jgi:riboflavin kinase/FMN adenylyltransferase